MACSRSRRPTPTTSDASSRKRGLLSLCYHCLHSIVLFLCALFEAMSARQRREQNVTSSSFFAVWCFVLDDDDMSKRLCGCRSCSGTVTRFLRAYKTQKMSFSLCRHRPTGKTPVFSHFFGTVQHSTQLAAKSKRRHPKSEDCDSGH